MARRRQPTDDPLAPVTLAVGQEDLLLDRAVQQVVAAARAADADTDVRDLTPGQLQPGTLAELTSPSLFAERKVVVVRERAGPLRGHGQGRQGATSARPPRRSPWCCCTRAAPRARALLDAARKAGAREVACPKMTKPADRLAFVRSEFRAPGRSATPEACQALVDCHRQRSAGAGQRPARSSPPMSRAPSTRPSSPATTRAGPRPPASPSRTVRSRAGPPRRWRRCAGRLPPVSPPS